MNITMQVIDKDGSINHSTFDEIELREDGQDIGEALGEAIDMELSFPNTRSITITVNV